MESVENDVVCFKEAGKNGHHHVVKWLYDCSFFDFKTRDLLQYILDNCDKSKYLGLVEWCVKELSKY